MLENSDWDYLLYMIISAIVASFLLFLIIIYLIRWRQKTIAIMQVLTILLFNQLFECLCEMISYINNIGYELCILSMVGRLAFTVASNFWIIFITRLIYRQKLAPGKYFNLVNFMFKNILIAYIPSIILGIFLILILTVTKSKSEDSCWKIILDKDLSDYIIYLTCFILPNLITTIIISIYLWLYFKLADSKWTIFLLIPLSSITFSIYYLSIKTYQFYSQQQRQPLIQIPFIVQSLFFGILYFVIYLKQKKKKPSGVSLDLTLHQSQIEGSFIQQF